MPEIEPLIDTEYLSEVSGGDIEFEKELIQAFLDAAPDLIDACVTAIAANDIPQVVYASHTLKGSSKSIGAKRFAAVAEQIERAARTNDIGGCRKLAPNLDHAYQNFEEVGRDFLSAA